MYRICVTRMFCWHDDVLQPVLVTMQLSELSRCLFVLIDGEPADSGLVRTAREYADTNACSITLLRVLPEVNRAFRGDRGVVIPPGQTRLAMKAYSKRHLEKLKAQFLVDRARPTSRLVRFGDLINALATASDAGPPPAVIATSTAPS